MSSLTRIALTTAWTAISGGMTTNKVYRICNNEGSQVFVAESGGTPGDTTSYFSLERGDCVDWLYDGTAIYARSRIANVSADIIEVVS